MLGAICLLIGICLATLVWVWADRPVTESDAVAEGRAAGVGLHDKPRRYHGRP